MANEEKIIIPAKRLNYIKPGMAGVVKVSPKVYNMLVDLANESGRPMNRIATAIIEQAVEKDLVELERSYSPESEEGVD